MLVLIAAILFAGFAGTLMLTLTRLMEIQTMPDDDLKTRVLSFDHAEDITCKKCGATLIYDPRPVVAQDDGDPEATSQVRLHCPRCPRTAFVREKRFQKRHPKTAEKASPREKLRIAIQLSPHKDLGDFKKH
jgi:ribosomal protein S27AE